MKIHEILGVKKITGVHFGVECEVEGERLPHIADDVWRTEADGSLRNGLEYVFDGPLKPKEAKAALEELFNTFKVNRSKLDYSFRTSTHVHVNVRDLEVKQAINIVFLYSLVEDLFTNFCAPHRRGNRFCLRFKDAEHLYTTLSGMITRAYSGRGGDAIHVLDQNLTKYSALNLFTLQKYGTLEFRTLEGTNDYDKIVMWLDTIQRLVEVGKDFDDLETLHNAFFQDPEAMIDLIFKDDVFKFNGWKQSVEESYSQSYQLVLASQGVM